MAAALLAGNLSAPNLTLAQAQTAPAPSPPTSNEPAAPSPGEATAPALPSAAPSSATAPAQPTAPMKQMTVSALTDKALEDITGSEIGDIERVVERVADKKQYIVVSTGGFLGLFETKRAVPLDNVAVQGGYILLYNMTYDHMKTLPRFGNYNDNAHRELDNGQTVTIIETK
jgi:hypothetical protein